MKPDHILVRFGELTTKGKNRKLFIRKLLKNTKEILHDYSALEYELTYDRLYIYLNQASNLSALMQSGGSVSDSAVKSALSGKVIKYTISMVTVIPILVVYPFMQRYFEKGIMLGAVKG